MECIVCTDELNAVEVACNHQVHLRCIALSGQNTCPVCRQAVQFNNELQRLFEEHQRRNQEHFERMQMNESRDLAQQLRAEDGVEEGEDEEEPQRFQRNFQILRGGNGMQYRVEVQEVNRDRVPDVGDLMLEVNNILVQMSNNTRNFQASEDAVALYEVMMLINRVSATSGLSVDQVCTIVQNLV